MGHAQPGDFKTALLRDFEYDMSVFELVQVSLMWHGEPVTPSINVALHEVVEITLREETTRVGVANYCGMWSVACSIRT